MPRRIVTAREQFELQQPLHPGAAQGWSHDPETDTYTHPSGHVLRPSDEAPGHQLWAPTVTWKGPPGLAKDRQPHPDLQSHFDWVERTGAAEPHSALAHPPLPELWQDYSDWHNELHGSDHEYRPEHSVQNWGNVEEYLQDRHGLSPYAPEALDHPVSFGMAKLHSLAQSRPQVDGHDYMLSDDDLTSGAALGLLKIRKNDRTKKLEPAWNPLDHFRTGSWYCEAVDDSDASWDTHIRQRLKDQGGHTFREHPSESPPSSGFQVSQTPDGLHPADSFKGRQVRDFRDKNRQLLDSDPANSVGIWQQPEGVYNEVSKNHPNYWDAVRDAYDRDQIAFHNNSTHDDIDVAGTQYNGDPGWYMARHD